MPSWHGLTNLNQVVSVDFMDATKLEQLVKVSKQL